MAGEGRVSGIMETKLKGISPLKEGQMREREFPNNKRRDPETEDRILQGHPKARASERLLCGPKWGYDSRWPLNIGG